MQYKRETRETTVEIEIDSNICESFVDTGIGFFDHMLLTFLKYSDLKGRIKVTGDLYVDCHHTIEDTGISLGKAIEMIIKEKPVRRYGSSYIPMDDALVRSVIDMGGRPFLEFGYEFKKEKLGEYDTDMTKEFLRGFTMNSLSTLHIDVIRGGNEHHITEAIYKSLGVCVREAIEDLESKEIFSLKGKINE